MQQILCTAAMHAQNNIIVLRVSSIECLYTKGLFAWVLGQLSVQPESGLSLVYLKKELFKFSLTASIMASCMSCHLFQDITDKSFAFLIHKLKFTQFQSFRRLCNVHNPCNSTNSPFKTCSLVSIHPLICPNVVAMPIIA